MARKKIFSISIIVCWVAVVLFAAPHSMYGQQDQINIDASSLRPKAFIIVNPPNQTTIEGSTFDVSFFLNTNKQSINTFDLSIGFDQTKLEIIKPSGGKSISSIWIQPPSYSNTNGTAKFAGVIPNGIVTESGLMTAITFRAKTSGQAIVSILANTRVLANDGMGSQVPLESNKGVYTIVPKAPEGPVVFSETHPLESKWYNNNNPVISWQKDSDVTNFSYELDNEPFTVPDNTGEGSTSTVKAYENLPDGLWHFHIKAYKKGIWGAPTHFLIRIDTTPPAEFTPKQELLTAAVINRVLVSFFTTDALSGINHYEVGVIDKTKSPVESPAFVETESPYQLPTLSFDHARIIVRAIDNAGNVRDESLDTSIEETPQLSLYLMEHLTQILIGFLGLIFFLIILHYLFSHHIARRFRRAVQIVENEEAQKEGMQREAEPKQDEHIQNPPGSFTQ